jgi:hypothetical protein
MAEGRQVSVSPSEDTDAAITPSAAVGELHALGGVGGELHALGGVGGELHALGGVGGELHALGGVGGEQAQRKKKRIESEQNSTPSTRRPVARRCRVASTITSSQTNASLSSPQ